MLTKNANKRPAESEEEERRKHFQNAHSNYLGVLRILEGFKGEIPHAEERFPENWQEDLLLLMGQYLKLLNLDGDGEDSLRKSISEMVKNKGARYVWENRLRLAAEIEFLNTF